MSVKILSERIDKILAQTVKDNTLRINLRIEILNAIMEEVVEQ